MSKDIQYRGHCPCCGNQQAVLRGRMSKHGYTVQHGWFQGVCPGQVHPPIEKDRFVADMVVRDVRQEAVDLVDRADALELGKIFPASAEGPMEWITHPSGRKEFTHKIVPFLEADEFARRRSVENETFRCRSRARQGFAFAEYLEGVIKARHGKPLIEVERKAPAAEIKPGEKRRYTADTVVLTARYQAGARVYYVDPRGFHGWVGTQSWRKMEIVES